MKVSIICTNYNKGDWIAEAIESFLHQEIDFPYEIILIDDASTDHSPDIIRDYQTRYPELIRVIFNETNQGIVKTWKQVCQLARGQYVARCDGDDYWTDNYKLQKQLALLEEHPTAKWSNTDFDLVDKDGRVFQSQVLMNQHLPFMDSYHKMLALKGMTMSSTWLIERNLLLEVNQELDDEATDDTFDLQLELFRRTELAFLAESTTVYRVVEESDSRTRDLEKFQLRLKGIYNTQNRYLQKYDETDFKEVCRLQAEHDIEQEMRALKAEQTVLGLQVENELIQKEHADLVEKYGQLLHQYHSVVNSRRWTIPTRLIDWIKQPIKFKR